MDPYSNQFAPPKVPVRQDWLDRLSEPVLEPDLPIIDAHHHIWDRPGERYRTEELLADLNDGHNVRASVFVQCRTAYLSEGPPPYRPLGETAYIDAIAQAHRASVPRVAAGIVCMADLMLGDEVRPLLEAHLEASPAYLRGVRNMTTSHESIVSMFGRIPPHRLLDPRFREGFAHLAPLGLLCDVWAFHTQLGEVVGLARAFPDTSIVLDHLGGPLGIGPFAGRRDEVFADWAKSVRAVGECPNVSMKVGGFGMHLLGFAFDERSEPPDSEVLAKAFRPYVEVCIEAFGVERCMFESNFPVDKGMFGYRSLWNAFKRLTVGYSASERAALFHDTAARVYRLGDA